MSFLANQVLSTAHLRAIGLVAAEWSYVELHLETLVWHMIGIDNERGYSVTTHIGSETRIHILETLADWRLPGAIDLKAKLRQCVADLRRLRMERNNIVHAVWTSTKAPRGIGLSIPRGRRPTPQSVKITAKGQLKITNKRWPSSKIVAIANEIGGLGARMTSLLSQLQADEQRRQALARALRAYRSPVQNPGPKAKGRSSTS